MKDYLLLLIADLMLAVGFAISKIYQKSAGTSFRAGFIFSALSSLFTSLIFWVYNGFKFGLTWFSFVIAMIGSVLCTAYTLIGFRIMKRRGMSLYTLFLMTGGMTLPYLFGLVFLKESFSIFRLIGLALIIAGVFFSVLGKGKPDKLTVILCSIVFVLNGFVSIVNKIHGINVDIAADPQEFVVLSGLINFVINIIFLYTVKDPTDHTDEELTKSKNPILILVTLALLSSIVGGVSSVLQLEGAKYIDASLLYPFITGGSIVLSSLAGWIFFKEKATKNMIISVALAFVGTLFFLQL